MNKKIIIRFLCALGISFLIILFVNHTEKYIGRKDLSGDKTKTGIQNPKIRKKQRTAFDSAVDWENHTITVYWRPAKNVSKYHIVCYATEDGDMETKGEQDISAVTEPSYTHKIVYGEKYEYEIRIYKMIAGKECWVTTKSYDLDIIAPSVYWECDSTNTMNKEMEYTKLHFHTQDISPMGIEIYRGENKKQMEQVDTVMWDELLSPDENMNYIKEYMDKSKSYVNYYQIRSFVDVDGKRQYGEKSEIKRFLAEGYRGEVNAKVKLSQKRKINKMEVIMTNKSKLPFRMGRKYIKNYFKDETEKEFPFCLYAYAESDGTANRFGIDEISYKFHSSDEYQILSEKDTVSINSQETIYIRFARSDHKKFENLFYDFSEEGIYSKPEDMCIYLFQYMGESVFLYINNDPLYTRIGWEKLDEPYGSDLTA